MTVMYIHGYGSDCNATKGQLLRKMLPQCRVVSPTFDYLHCTPWQIQKQIHDYVEEENVSMLVGSSFGGYQALCATAFFHGPVWVVNPVHDVVSTIRRVIINSLSSQGAHFDVVLFDVYSDFNQTIFCSQSKLNQSGRWPADTPLNFALSTDDELLGDHHPLLDLFPHHDKVVWKGNSGHVFLKFEELQADIEQSLGTETASAQ